MKDIIVEGKAWKTMLNVDRLVRKLMSIKVSKAYSKTRGGKYKIKQ
jgi:hypothetical protein